MAKKKTRSRPRGKRGKFLPTKGPLRTGQRLGLPELPSRGAVAKGASKAGGALRLISQILWPLMVYDVASRGIEGMRGVGGIRGKDYQARAAIADLLSGVGQQEGALGQMEIETDYMDAMADLGEGVQGGTANTEVGQLLAGLGGRGSVEEASVVEPDSLAAALATRGLI